MGMDQMVYAPPETWLQRHRRRRRQRRHLEPLDADPRGGCVLRSRCCSAWPRRSSASPVASLTVDQRRRLGRRQDREVRRPDRRQDVQLHHDGAQTVGHAGSGHREAGQPVQGRRQVVPADRHPGQGERQLHLHPERHASPGCCTRGASARAAPAPTRRRTTSRLSVDETSIKHIPGAQVVQINNFLAVVAPKEYDAIQAAAQLKVVWKSDPKLSGLRQLLGLAPQGGRHEHDEPAALHDRRHVGDGATQALAGAAKTVSATYKYQYNGFMPIGPHCAIADVRMDQRATVFLQQQALNGVPANDRRASTGIAGRRTCRVIFARGRELVRRRSVRRGLRAGRDPLEGSKQPVRMQWMRWDQHGWDHARRRRTCTTSRWASTRPARSSAPTGDLRPGQQRTSTRRRSCSARTRLRHRRHVAGDVPGDGGVAPSDSAVYNTGYARRVLAKTQPLYGGAFRCNFLRAPNAPQSYFASEQIVDELAYAIEHGPGRVPPAEHRRLERRRRALAGGDRRVDAWPPAGSRRSPRRTCRPATS